MHSKRGNILLTLVISVLCAFLVIVFVGFFVSERIINNITFFKDNNKTATTSSALDETESNLLSDNTYNKNAEGKYAIDYVDYAVSDLLVELNNIYNIEKHYNDVGYIYNNELIPHIKFEVKLSGDSVFVNTSKVKSIVVESGGTLFNGFVVGDVYNKDIFNDLSYKTEGSIKDEFYVISDTPTYNVKIKFDGNTNKSTRAVITVK